MSRGAMDPDSPGYSNDDPTEGVDAPTGDESREKDQAWVVGQALAEEWRRTYAFHQGSLKNAWEILARAAIRAIAPEPQARQHEPR